MDWNPFVPRRDRGRRVEMNGTRDEMERSGSLFSLSRRPTGACVARARHRARTRFSKPGEKRPRASPLLEINGQFMEIGWMYGNWLATSWRYAGGDHPQVLEWLLDAVTRMKPRPCSSIFPGRRRRLLEERNVDRSWTTTIVAILWSLKHGRGYRVPLRGASFYDPMYSRDLRVMENGKSFDSKKKVDGEWIRWCLSEKRVKDESNFIGIFKYPMNCVIMYNV